MIKVEGHKNLYRDEKTGAIVNCDTIAYEQYKKRKNIKKTEREELDQIKSDIEEIKMMLKQITNK